LGIDLAICWLGRRILNKRKWWLFLPCSLIAGGYRSGKVKRKNKAHPSFQDVDSTIRMVIVALMAIPRYVHNRILGLEPAPLHLPRGANQSWCQI
jgi:hypothetical protein